jgi:aryl-alcohol dehydrogenase-like predicted oxidoreductase
MNLYSTKNDIQTGYLGDTGVQVTRLGAGLAEIGSLNDSAIASKILNLALDQGINFLDTAACYGNSEEWIGKFIAHRRNEYFLATKAGHILNGNYGKPWTYQTILDSINRSLKKMRTSYLDLVQLHSCGTDILKKGEAINALQQAKHEGKTRFIGYSGNLVTAEWAVQSNIFDTIQVNFNLLDQFALTSLLKEAKQKKIGVITKHSIANAVWGAQNISDRSLEVYRQRAKAMSEEIAITKMPQNPILTALGFVLAHTEIDVALVGTKNIKHMEENINLFKNDLPIPCEVVYELRSRFRNICNLGS